MGGTNKSEPEGSQMSNNTSIDGGIFVSLEDRSRRELSGSFREALDNRSPVEAVPCTSWELRTLTGAAEGFSRASLAKRANYA